MFHIQVKSNSPWILGGRELDSRWQTVSTQIDEVAAQKRASYIISELSDCESILQSSEINYNLEMQILHRGRPLWKKAFHY